MVVRFFQFRCKIKIGQYFLSGLNLDFKIGQLKDKIIEVIKIFRGVFIVRQGYFLKVIDISEEDGLLFLFLFRFGDILIVEGDRKLQEEFQQQRMDNVIQKQFINFKGILMRKVVFVDNFCLFISINVFMNKGVIDLFCFKVMREIIVGVVMSDFINFSEAFLGKINNVYCYWIMNLDFWGGVIEIFIFLQYFNVEIVVVDIQSCRIDRFGEDKFYKERIFVIYDGIYYDSLIMEFLDFSLLVQTIFLISDVFVFG